jgi:hypothetical protein
MVELRQPFWIESVLRTFSRWEAIGFVVMPDGARLVGHVPHVAELAYLHCVPAALLSGEIDELSRSVGVPFPLELREWYGHANGLSAFSDTLNIHGLRKSYQRSDPLAASAQPYNIVTPNRVERPLGLADSEIVVGGYSLDGSHLVLGSSGAVFRCARNDAHNVYNRWPCFSIWLVSEVVRLSGIFDEAGRCTNTNLRLPKTT